jgi:hypothetical protein
LSAGDSDTKMDSTYGQVYFRLPDAHPSDRFGWRSDSRDGKDSHAHHGSSQVTADAGNNPGSKTDCPFSDGVKGEKINTAGEEETWFGWTESMMDAFIELRGPAMLAESDEPDEAMVAQAKTEEGSR